MTVFSNLGFVGIMGLLEPILFVVYPAVIMLTLVNVLYKLISFRPARAPVFATIIIVRHIGVSKIIENLRGGVSRVE